MSPPGAVEITQKLIQKRSVTPADDGALPYLRELLAAAGFLGHQLDACAVILQ